LTFSMKQLGGAMKVAAVASLPLAFAMGKGVKTAASFEQAMADLGAVSRASEKDMDRLSKKAKEMGVVTAFSATESAQAMEMLARAGAKTEEQIGGVKGVLDLAAAGNVHYAESSDIVATVTRGMGRKFAQSGNLADILAAAASGATVTVSSLGESFRYGMAQARIMGIETEELTAIFGKLGDASLRGSMGGTALTAMLSKLASPSRRAAGLMKKWEVSLTDAHGKMLPISTIIDKISKKLGGITDAGERAKTMTEIFGRRGQKAYAALAAAGKESLDLLTTELRQASDGIGVAAEMAKKRLNTLIGAFKMLSATVEGMSIAVYGPVRDDIKKFVQEATGGLNSVLFAMQDLQEAQKTGADLQATATKLAEKHGAVAVSVALGLLDITKFLKDAWQGITKAVKNLGVWIKKVIGVEGIRTLVAMAGKVAAVTAVVGPLTLAIGAIGFVITRSVIPAVMSLGGVIKLALGPWGLLIGGVIALLSKTIEKIRGMDDAVGGATLKWEQFERQADGSLRKVGEVASKTQTKLTKQADRFLGALWAGLKAIVDTLSEGLVHILELLGIIERPPKVVWKGAEKWGVMPTPEAPELAGIARIKEKAARAKMPPEMPTEVATRLERERLRKEFRTEMERRFPTAKPMVDVNINNRMCIDGRDVAHSIQRQQTEIQERAGFKTTPWQRRMSMEHGAMPATVSVRSS
jgi:TP901 family phage tail tape measure protein